MKCGGSSEQTIRNKNGYDYCAILKAWAEFSVGFATRQKIKQESTTADGILASIKCLYDSCFGRHYLG